MTIKITPEAVKERIAALESAGEISLKEQFYLEYMRESLDKDRRIEQLTAERDALREEGIGTNTKAAADIYFQLVEELDVPPGGSLVQCIDNMRERLAAKQLAPVVPDELLNEIDDLLSVCRVYACRSRRNGSENDIPRTEKAQNWLRACRAAMLQAAPVCTCPSGDGSLRWPCPVHPGNSPVVPDGIERVASMAEYLGNFAAAAIIRQLAVNQPQNAPQNIPEIIPDSCTWTFSNYDDHWSGACGVEWIFPDGGPEENGVKFCPKCGKSVAVSATEGTEE